MKEEGGQGIGERGKGKESRGVNFLRGGVCQS